MFSWKAVLALSGATLINFNVSTCHSASEGGGGDAPSAEPVKDIELPGVDTKQLTHREKRQWSTHVSELLTPCKEHPVDLAQCVTEKRACKACLPAAKYLAQMVREGLTKGQTESAYRARFAPDQVKDIDISGSPSKGPDGAPVVIVEWADFECPACQAAVPVIDAVAKEYRDQVKLVFKHFPLAIHEHAESAARAAVAADQQGKFWQMHKGLFSTDPPLTKATMERIAAGVDGLDLAQWKTAFESEKVADVVARDRKQGDEVKLTGTPTLFINGRRFSSTGDQQADLEAWVALELELLGQQSVKKPKAPKAPASATKPAESAASPEDEKGELAP
jgi:protein-disulfide isomerase